MSTVELYTCPDCGVNPGEQHKEGCDVARCPITGYEQRLQCDCDPEPGWGTWSGEWPGVAECREFGWYTHIAGVPELVEDLNRLNIAGIRGELVWDLEQERWVLPIAG